MLAFVAALLFLFGAIGIIPDSLALLWGLFFLALGVAFGWWPIGAGAPWHRTQP